MSEFRELLEREGERFTLSPGGLERLRRRQHRHQRNRRIVTGVLVLSLSLGGVLLAVRAFRGVRPEPRPADEPRVVDTSSTGVRPVALTSGEGAIWIVSAAERTLVRLDEATGEVVDQILIDDDAGSPVRVGPPIRATVSEGSVWVQTSELTQTSSAPPTFLPAVVRVDAATGRILGTISLGHFEGSRIAVGMGTLWSFSSGTGLVSRRDLPGGRVTATAQGPPHPVELAFGEGAVWALGPARADVAPTIPSVIARIDPDTGSVTSSMELDFTPQPSDQPAEESAVKQLAVGEGAAWVVSAADGAVLRIDPDTFSVTDRIRVPGRPTEITVGPKGVWVLDTAAGILLHIDPDERRVVGSVSVGLDAVALAAGQESVWVARSDGKVLRIQP